MVKGRQNAIPGRLSVEQQENILRRETEALDLISAASRSNYDLVEAGTDGAFDTTDDVPFDLTPQYSFPDTRVVLDIVAGPLADGQYRLTLSGTGTKGARHQGRWRGNLLGTPLTL